VPTRVLLDRTAARISSELQAAVVGSLLGGAVAGLLLALIARSHLRLVGSLLGTTSLPGSVLVWLALAVVLGVGFYYVIGRTLDAYVRSVMGLTAKNAFLRKLLLPLVMRSALGTTAGALGLTYGLACGSLVGFVALPALVGVLTGAGPGVPAVDGAVLVTYVVFGLVMGLGYGLTLER
jgi:hypothetical protein